MKVLVAEATGTVRVSLVQKLLAGVTGSTFTTDGVQGVAVC